MAKENVQQKLRGIPPPRVHITYKVKVGDAVESKEIPFVMGILGNFTGERENPLPLLRDRKLIELTPDNFDAVLATMRPHLSFSVENKLSEDAEAQELRIDLRFNSLEDFEPESVVAQIGALRELLDLRTTLADFRAALIGNNKLCEFLFDSTTNRSKFESLRSELLNEAEPFVNNNPTPDNEVQATGSLLEQITHQMHLSGYTALRNREKTMVRTLVDQISNGYITISEDPEQDIELRIRQIDHLISIELDQILHHPEFQALEGTWRGLKYLVDHCDFSEILKIKALNATKKELLRDLQRVPQFDESVVYRKVSEEAFGAFNSEPFSVLIADYEFGRQPEDIELLEKISQIAASIHAPFLSAAAPALLNLVSFTELGAVRDLSRVLDSTEYSKWKHFRQSEEARYVGLCLPHILLRPPHGCDGKPVSSFNYEESIGGADHKKYLWGNAAYALAAKLNNAFATYGWCAAIRGVEGGGLVDGLPTHTFRTDDGDLALKCPTEIAITERLEKELADLGFIPLVHCKNTDYAAFFSVQSCQKPKRYDRESANANARLSAQLTYTLAMSRFAHYIKMIMLNTTEVLSAEKCQRLLQEWLMQHVSADANQTPWVQARLPLRDATIDVIATGGILRATVFLRPTFQLDELTTSLRLVVDLPQRPLRKVARI